MNWVDFIKQSTITQTLSIWWGDLSKPKTKLEVTLAHFHSSGAMGWRKPLCLICLALTCWETIHLATISYTSLHPRQPIWVTKIMIHLYRARMNWNSRVMCIMNNLLLQTWMSRNFQNIQSAPHTDQPICISVQSCMRPLLQPLLWQPILILCYSNSLHDGQTNSQPRHRSH